MKKYKECFIKNGGCGPINKETKKAVRKETHILSRAATMSQLTGEVNGQNEVYRASTGKSEGWKKASAYHCFCGNHDDKVFKPIEDDNEFNPKDKEHLFLHSFRSFAYSYHKKRIEMDRIYSLFFGFSKSSFNIISKDELNTRYKDHMFSHQRIREKLVEIYDNKSFNDLKYKVFIIKKKFPFASAGTLIANIVSEEMTSIVYYDESESQLARPGIMLTVFPDTHKDQTNVILACLKSDKNGIFFLRKFNDIKQKQLFLGLSSLMLTTNRENTFFHPVYWHAIQNNSKTDKLNIELQKKRGFDLLNGNLQLSEFNLFKKELTSEQLLLK